MIPRPVTFQHLALVHRKEQEFGAGIWEVGPGEEMTCLESRVDTWAAGGLRMDGAGDGGVESRVGATIHAIFM